MKVKCVHCNKISGQFSKTYNFMVLIVCKECYEEGKR